MSSILGIILVALCLFFLTFEIIALVRNIIDIRRKKKNNSTKQ